MFRIIVHFLLLCLRINQMFTTCLYYEFWCFDSDSLFLSIAISTPPLSAPNNIIKLIIKTYVNDLFDQQMPDDELRQKLSSMR